MSNWKAEIARIVYWKQIAADHDRNGALPWHLPRVGASRAAIDKAETASGVTFSSEFKEFLACANGWQAFHVLTNLFGTDEFLTGKHELAMQRSELTNFLKEMNLTKTDVVVFGSSEFDIDVFLLISLNSPVLPGGILWFANEEVERHSSFAEFFSAMTLYNEKIARKLSSEV